MRIIITESQLYNLIPRSLKRRMSPDDFDILDSFIKDTKKQSAGMMGIYNNFADYRDDVLKDGLNEFVDKYKIERDDDDELDWDYTSEQESVFDLYWDLLPFLRKIYHDELYEFYSDHKL